MAIDISSCLTAIQSMKSKVARCFVACANKGSTFNGTQTLSNLESAISLIPTVSGGSGLKNGYTQLEYIESTGTQYINTNYNPNSNTRVVMDVDILSDKAINSVSNSYLPAVFGARNSSSSRAFALWVYSSTKFRSDFGGHNLQITVNSSVERYNIDKNKNVTNLNTTVGTNNNSSFQTSYPLTLFAMNSAGSIDVRMLVGRLYSCQIYNDGVIVRDFVPCKNTEGVVGLYDVVNDKFYGNAGTGEFLAGGEIGEVVIGTSFGGFNITYGDNTYTIDFGSIGVGWKSIVCYSDTKDGHFAIHKTSGNKCVICASVFYDASNQFDEAFGIFPNQRNTYRATYSVSGNSITFTNAEYDGTSNGMTNHDSFGAMPQQVSTDVNDYFTNQYKLDKITVVI